MHKVNTWQGDEAESDFWNTFTGRHKRFRNLHDVVRQVQVETRIIKRWRKRQNTVVALCHRQVALDLDSWENQDVFRIDQECQQPLTQVFMAIWTNRNLDLLSRTPDTAVLAFMQALEAAYKENPYHNRRHAADVTLTVFQLWARLSEQTRMRGYYSEVDLLAMMVAAAIHDVGHPGVNNEFMVKTQSALALQYNDRSVLEHFHAATAFALMKDTGAALLEHKLVNPPPEALKTRVVDMVLATDMARHKEVVNDMVAEVRDRPNSQDIDKLVLEKHIVHVADIGHPLRPVPLHQKWSHFVQEEFLAQGDKEKELGFVPGPLFDREKTPTLAKSQVGFLNFVFMPAWKPLSQVLGGAAKPLDRYLQANLENWDELAKREDADAGERLVASPARSRRSTAEF